MSVGEIGIFGILVYIAWEVREWRRVMKALVCELGSHRWQQGIIATEIWKRLEPAIEERERALR